MDNQNRGYGPLMVFLSQVLKNTLQNPQSPPLQESENTEKQPNLPVGGEVPEAVYFAEDETECRWRKEERVELLAEFCREGSGMAGKYGHFLLGTGNKGTFLAVPGRFLLAEQPAGGVTGFTLWQPLAGGELHYDSLDAMSESEAVSIYGYWIARLDPETLKITEV